MAPSAIATARAKFSAQIALDKRDGSKAESSAAAAKAAAAAAAATPPPPAPRAPPQLPLGVAPLVPPSASGQSERNLSFAFGAAQATRPPQADGNTSFAATAARRCTLPAADTVMPVRQQTDQPRLSRAASLRSPFQGLRTPAQMQADRPFPGGADSAAGGRGDAQSEAGAAPSQGPAARGRIEWAARLPGARGRGPLHQAVTLQDGEKIPYTPEEAARLSSTPYAHGRLLYVYEGGLKHVRQKEAPPVPPGGVHNPLYALRNSTGEPHSILKYPYGDQFEGDWRAGARHGFGTLRTCRGYRYQGEWRDDQPSGKGEEEFAHHEMVKSDSYFNLRPTGKATIIYQPQECGTRYRYVGDVKGGRRHGRGRIHYDNGDVFEGEFREGRRHGVGVVTYADSGRQFEGNWVADELQGMLHETGSGSPRTRAAAAAERAKEEEDVQVAAACLAPADLTKWRVREGVTDLSLEHFHRLKAGFENLDAECNGELSTAELRKAWGNKDQHMLKKLDRNNDGSVDLYEVLLEWYPDVPVGQLLRLVQIEPDLRAIHRMRGRLGDAPSDTRDGFYDITAAEGGLLSLATLEAAGFTIGGERFSLACWKAAAALSDPPGFTEVLEAWYRNTPRAVLERYDMARLPYSELDAIYTGFKPLEAPGGGFFIDVAQCKEARRQHRLELKRRAAPQQQRQRAVTTVSVTATNLTLMRRMRPYFFKGEPCWALGRHIRVTVPMLERVIATLSAAQLPCLHPCRPGHVHLLELLRFAFPNVPCMRTFELLQPVEALLGADPGDYVPPECACDICDFARHRGIGDPVLERAAGR
eukprot:TRINITY_DN35023_c0_g1_i1.p1 TRINITY_DN35023_c0_g1~~TRINITY_DN35023_c0_g1_i1.p1  ORF type:complete len:815 (+),score=262.49 TRINITY_DN35023_c0_g1_i1:68-2512(+)